METERFKKLTPVDNVELGIYEEAFDFVFSNDDIKNVAVSGAYSAGKSSLLATYKKKHEEIRFLHISLAHFQPLEKSEEENNKQSEGISSELVLEGKILNQLIHQISTEKIPQTNFRVKGEVNSENVLRKTIAVLTIVLCWVHVIFFNEWKDFVSSLPDGGIRGMLSFSANSYSLILSGIILMVLLGNVIYKFIETQRFRNFFRKFSFQGNEIEILEENKDSYFDKYLNEVLYLFENSGEDVIVFEDMDRFNTGLVFEHLHEINTLANQHLKKFGKKTLRFFYLIRDDIFVSKDRTKFFDYIIPVIPVVDSSNSYNKIIEYFTDAKILDKFDQSFLQGLSLYIDDLRILKNIFNEFLIYYEKLNTTELDPNRMLGIVTYKNIFPKDFCDLQLNQGFVYAIFSSKDQYIKNEIISLQNKIKEIKERIDNIENECAKSLEELYVLFAYRYYNNYNWEHTNDLGAFLNSHMNQNQKNELEYRKSILKDGLEGKTATLNVNIREIEHEMENIKNKKLHHIINRDNIDRIFDVKCKNDIGKEWRFEEIKGSEYFDLLKYLIRYGFIDETYADYMTYFYENSLSHRDKAFLRSITDQRAKDYTYQLDRPELVIAKLRLVDFEQREILNFALFDWLLKESVSYDQYLKRIINQLRATWNFSYIREYLDWTTDDSAFVRKFNKEWPEMFSLVIQLKKLTSNQIRKYTVSTLYYCSDEDIKQVNEDSVLTLYINAMKDYLHIDKPDIEKLIRGLLLLKVKFYKIDYAESDPQLLQAVLLNELYEINYENIKMILTEIYGIKQENDIRNKNYTLIISQKDTFLADYIHKNMGIYMDEMLKICGNNIYDNEDAALGILNSEVVSREQKEQYISKLRTIISTISAVADQILWKELLNQGIIQYSEENIMAYFEKGNLDESLAQLINSGKEKLDFSKYAAEQRKALFDAIVVSKNLNIAKYREYLVTLDFVYDSFGIKGISEDNMKFLLEEHIIQMTKKSLQFIRQNYAQFVYYYIQENLNEYVDIMDDTIFSFDELMMILNWDIAGELKENLLKHTKNPISIMDKGYATSLCVYILKNNVMNSELPELFARYEMYSKDIQEMLYSLAVENFLTIIKNVDNVSDLLKKNLLLQNDLSKSNKANLLIAMIPSLNDDELKAILKGMNLTEYLKIFESRTRPKIPVDRDNEAILIALQQSKKVRSFEIDEQREGFYKISKAK